MWKQEPDGFASLPGYGLEKTTGGQSGRTVTASSIGELQDYAAAGEPLVIFIRGTLKAADYMKIPVSANKSFIGVGAGAEVVNAGFKLINVSNVIFRNFTVRDSYIPGTGTASGRTTTTTASGWTRPTTSGWTTTGSSGWATA